MEFSLPALRARCHKLSWEVTPPLASYDESTGFPYKQTAHLCTLWRAP